MLKDVPIDVLKDVLKEVCSARSIVFVCGGYICAKKDENACARLGYHDCWRSVGGKFGVGEGFREDWRGDWRKGMFTGEGGDLV